MNRQKQFDVLPFLSKERLAALKKKLEKKNQVCPGRATPQLDEPSTSQVGNQFLRNLKSKSSQPQIVPSANEQLVQSVNNTARGGPSHPLGDITNQDSVLPERSSNGVFVAPTMRAPRAAKTNTNYLINEFNPSARYQNEDCPIRAVTQLVQPSLSHMQPQSLRSLKTKPKKNCADSSVNLTAQTSMSQIKSTPSARVDPDSYQSFNTGASVGPRQASGYSMNGSSVQPERSVDGVFAVPTMRAPRVPKINTSELINKCNQSATYAWCNLDKEYAEQLFFILSVHLMGQIENLSPDNSNSGADNRNDILTDIRDYIDKIASRTESQSSEKQLNRMGLQEADNVSSVSGYQPYRGNFGHQKFRMQDWNSVGRPMSGFGGAYEPSVVGSAYDDFPNADRMSNVSVRSRMVPSFMKSRMESSAMHSMYQHRNDTLMNQADRFSTISGRDKYLPVLKNSRMSNYMMGSMHPTCCESFMYQNQFNPQGMQGQTMSRPMSVRSDASFSCRPHNGNQTGFPTTMNHFENHQMNQTDLFRRNQQMANNTCNGGVRTNQCGDVNQSRYDQDSSEQLRRRVQAPLEPVVLVNRIIGLDSFSEQTGQNTSRMECDSGYPGVDNLHPGPKVLDKKNSNSSHQITQVEGTIIKTPKITVLKNKCTIITRGTSVDTPKRTPRNHDQTSSHDTTVTRSGRVVRPPQHFWMSDKCSNSTVNVTEKARGIKRKRN